MVAKLDSVYFLVRQTYTCDGINAGVQFKTRENWFVKLKVIDGITDKFALNYGSEGLVRFYLMFVLCLIKRKVSVLVTP